MGLPTDLSLITTNMTPAKLARVCAALDRESPHRADIKWNETTELAGYLHAKFTLHGETYTLDEEFEMVKSMYLEPCRRQPAGPFMSVVRGTSGTGKGTRVCQVLEYLKTKFEPTTLNFEFEGKTKQYGICFEDLKLIFIGTTTKSNKSGLSSWSSMDYIHSTVKKAENARPIAKSWIEKGYSLVLEGEPMMQSDKFRPLFMQPYFGVARFLMPHYWYQNREQYDERIMGRSGKLAGDSGWGRNESYKREYERTLEELQELELDATGCTLLPHDAPLEGYGASLLAYLGRADLIDEFVRWTAENPMLRSIGGGNPLATTNNVFDIFGA